MNRQLHLIHGLDHKCRTCGMALLHHDDAEAMRCPEGIGSYDPKGPKLPPELWALLLRMEDAAVTLNVVNNPLFHASQDEREQRKEEYKAARFALNSYLAERLTKLEAFDSMRKREQEHDPLL